MVADDLRPMASIVLAGGRSRRMGGPNKAALRYDGRPLLSLVVAACPATGPLVVVAPWQVAQAGLDEATRGRVDVVTNEDPPHGGPVAGIAAGLAALPPASTAANGVIAAAAPGVDEVLVLACDLPRAPELVIRLLSYDLAAAEPSIDAVTVVDEEGWRQPLAARYRLPALRRALTELPHTRDVSMRRLVSPLTFAELPVTPGVATDVDTPEQARQAGLDW